MTVTITNSGDSATSEGEFKIILDPNIEFGSILGGDFTGTPGQTIIALGRELTWPMPAGFLAPGQTKNVTIDTYVQPGSGVSGEVVFYARTSMFGNAMCGAATCAVNATTGEGNSFIFIEGGGGSLCPAGPDQTVCIPTVTLAASGTSGLWTQESGPSQARFGAATSPNSTV